MEISYSLILLPLLSVTFVSRVVRVFAGGPTNPFLQGGNTGYNTGSQFPGVYGAMSPEYERDFYGWRPCDPNTPEILVDFDWIRRNFEVRIFKL